MDFLVAGLGNPGSEYEHTRHNIGFKVLDKLAESYRQEFVEDRHGWQCDFRMKNKKVRLLKPNTFMNLSGKAIRYWLQKDNLSLKQLLVITDDLALPEGKLRLKGKGSDGGHNGLKSINELLGSQQYARLRFGIGDDYAKGQQVDYVLQKWSQEELAELDPTIHLATEITQSFVLSGLNFTMNKYNGL